MPPSMDGHITSLATLGQWRIWSEHFLYSQRFHLASPQALVLHVKSRWSTWLPKIYDEAGSFRSLQRYPLMSTSSGCYLCEQITGASASSSSRWGQVLPFYIKTMEDVRSSVGSESLVECYIQVNCELSHISSCEVLVRTTGWQSTCILSTFTWTSDSLLGSARSMNASVWKKLQYCSNRIDSNIYVLNRFNFVPGGSSWQSS